jgi:hypothetical protein
LFLNFRLAHQACAGDERSLVAAAASAILAERLGPQGGELRPAPQALSMLYDALRGQGWKVNEPGWRASERTAAVGAWHGVEASLAKKGLLAVLGGALWGQGAADDPVVALRLPNNELAGPVGAGLLQPLAMLQAGGGAALAEINVAGNALTGNKHGFCCARTAPKAAETHTVARG